MSSKWKIINDASSDALVEISPSPNVTQKAKVKERDNLNTSLCFDEAPKNDGSYLLHIKHAKLDTSFRVGYYTNGAPLDNGAITITDSDVKYKSSTRLY